MARPKEGRPNNTSRRRAAVYWILGRLRQNEKMEHDQEIKHKSPDIRQDSKRIVGRSPTFMARPTAGPL